MLRYLLIYMGFALISANAAEAANIRVVENHPEGCTAILTGEIEQGDTDRLISKVGYRVDKDRFDGFKLCLNSPGGSFLEGLELAKEFRRAGIGTHVAKNSSCLSACAIAFLGGSRRWFEVTDNTVGQDRTIHATAKLGFHAPQLNVSRGNFTENEVNKAFRIAIRSTVMIFSFLKELYIDQEFALTFFDVPDGEFYMIDRPERLKHIGLLHLSDVIGVGTLPETIEQPRLSQLCVDKPDHLGSKTEEFDPAFDRDHHYFGSGRTVFLDLPPRKDVIPGARYGILVPFGADEGSINWNICVVTYPKDRRNPIILNWFSIWKPATDLPLDDEVRPSVDEIVSELEKQEDHYGSNRSPLMAFPVGVKLSDLAALPGEKTWKEKREEEEAARLKESKENQRRELNETRRLAELGDPKAQTSLGSIYHGGWGVKSDYDEAIKWWIKAAEQGEAEAQYHAGVFYINNVSDYDKAAKWLRKASEQGHQGAQEALSTLYSWGYVPDKYPSSCWVNTRSATVRNVNEFVNIRGGTSLRAPIITRANLGERLTIFSPQNFWYNDNAKGRECSRLCENYRDNPSNQEITRKAQKCMKDAQIWHKVSNARGQEGFVSVYFLEGDD